MSATESRLPSMMDTSDLETLGDAYLESSLACGHSVATVAYRRVYLRQLRAWLKIRGIEEVRTVTPTMLANYVKYLSTRQTTYLQRVARKLSARTVATEVSVVRSFFAWVTACKVLQVNPAEELSAGRGTPSLPRAVLTVAQAQALMSAPGHDGVGLRDRAILETLYSTGLRRAELCNLDCYDVDVVKGLVMVRQGKGRRDRIVPIGRRAIEAVRVYTKEIRTFLVRNRKEPALFLAISTGCRLKLKTLNSVVGKHAERAGIAQHVMPITLRHTCATHLLQGGADVRDVQAILGHVCIETTQIYTRVTTEDLVAVHQRSHPRDRPRRAVYEERR